VSALLLIGALLVGVVVLTPLSDRVNVPQPVLVTVFGLAVALVPGVPELALDPSLILPVLLPPLLFAATQRTTVGEFRDSARPILVLAVGLTVATTAVVAVVAHGAGLAWPAAWVLGAVVSPPDPVAATAVARRLRLPHRMVVVLEGEGMFNDATALVLYKVAVAAAVTGQLSPGVAALDLLLALLVGVGLGVAVGWLARGALAVLHDPRAETTVTVVLPFIAYLGAEHLRGSGVLAVLALGLFLRSFGHPVITSGGWLLGRAVWDYVDFVLTSLTFALIGFELTTVLAHSSTDTGTVALAVAVLATLVLFRAVWTFPAVGVMRAMQRRANAETPYGWRETTVVAWAGMRGVVTVATALALPTTLDSGEEFPHRAQLILVALVCVLATLVGQGLTLSALVRFLRVGVEGDAGGALSNLRARAATAALEDLRAQAGRPDVPEGVHRAAILQYESYLSAQEALMTVRTEDADVSAPEQLEALLQRASDVERDLVLRARRSGEVSSATADEALHGIEARSIRDYD